LCASNSVALAASQSHSGSPVVLSESINPRPATAFSHASTILGGKGWVLEARFGETREQASDTGIWLSRRSGGQRTAPVEVANGMQPDGIHLPLWNRVIFCSTIMFFFTVGATAQNWWPMRVVSRN
jgi:hypothetical protein